MSTVVLMRPSILEVSIGKIKNNVNKMIIPTSISIRKTMIYPSEAIN